MDRLFKEHNLRKTVLLDGSWKFVARDGDNMQVTVPSDAVDMYVPSCWNLRLGLLDYQDIAWYYKEFESKNENILLSFGAVSGTAEVYLDGKLLGSHYGSYTEFSFVANTFAGKHLLAVKVDNNSNDETIPKKTADWYRYGGIYRSVELTELENTWIKRHKIGYTLKGKSANVTVVTEICGEVAKKLTVKFAGETVYDGEYKETVEFNVKNLKLWDIGEGNLYYIEIIIDDDDVIDRIGFRKIETNKGKFLLNGKAVDIKGVNHHEDWPDFGHAVPKSLMEKDIDIIKDLGCNFVRGSHYPNSRAFMDYLDQNGLLFWSEIPLWGAQSDTLSSEILIKRGCVMHKEMVEQYYNHPSIVMWGLHNEIDTRVEKARILTKRFIEVIRAYDTSRPIIMATDKVLDDICLDLVDIIGINKYIGWYGGQLEQWNGFLENTEKKLIESNLQDKPIIMSEFGAAGLYGYNTFDNIKWTEEYQANLLEFELKLFKKTPFICGSIVWQFCDGRTSATGIDRARGFNNKGILNEYRKPKKAYYTIKRIFTE